MKKGEEVFDLHISNRFELKPNYEVHYGNVLISGDGYFYMTGGNCLEIDRLEVKKETYHKKYDILIQGPDGEDGMDGEEGKDAENIRATNIVIHQLADNVRIKSLGGNGGMGGKGAEGNPGGDGGDAVCKDTAGGKGAGGSQGGKGKKGGRGSDGPAVTVRYTPGNEEAEVRILSRDDEENGRNKAYGGRGGDGGDGGDGGTGGNGGWNGDGKTRAKAGKKGDRGPQGDKGEDGEDIDIIIEKIITEDMM